MDYETIIDAMRAGRSARDLATQGVVSRNKAKEIRELVTPLGWLDPLRESPSAMEIAALLVKEPPVPVRASTLECCRDEVTRWHNRGYRPQQIFRKLKDLKNSRPDLQAFSVGAVKRFVRRLAEPDPEVFVALHFEPGEAAQVDFGAGPKFHDPATGKMRQSHVFVMTLCHSRHMYAELVWNQTVETWLQCHQNAFKAFGGVPQRVIIDNLKAAITRASVRDPVVQKSYHAFAADWGFQIDPNRPRTPRHKGRVESGVKYVKGAVFCYEDPTFERTQARLEEFVYGEAGHRIHGTTRQRPLEVFENEEKPCLQAIPSPAPEMFTWSWAKLDKTCHVYFEQSHYSAPYPYVGKKLLVKAGFKTVEVYAEEQRVAVHVRSYRPGTYRTVLAHYPPEKRGPVEMTQDRCLEMAARVGPHTKAYVQEQLADKCVRRLSRVRGVIRLAEKHEKHRVDAACKRAMEYGLNDYASIKRILEKGLESDPEPEDALIRQRYLAFIPTAKFVRNIGQMMSEAM